MQMILVISCSVVGTILAIATFQKTRDKDIRADTRDGAVVSTKLDYIQRGVDDIRLDIKAQDRRITGINNRLIIVEESTKSAHHRIDGLENKEGSNNNERSIN